MLGNQKLAENMSWFTAFCWRIGKHRTQSFKKVDVRPRPHCSVFVQNGGENLRFCESVHTDPHKNATKTDVFENAI